MSESSSVMLKNPFQNRGAATGKNAHPTAAVGWAFLPDRGSPGLTLAGLRGDRGGKLQEEGRRLLPFVGQFQVETHAVG